MIETDLSVPHISPTEAKSAYEPHEALSFIHRVERDNAEDFAGEIAADLRLMRKRYDICGLALMMIREGCSDPRRVAAEALRKSRDVIVSPEGSPK